MGRSGFKHLYDDDNVHIQYLLQGGNEEGAGWVIIQFIRKGGHSKYITHPAPPGTDGRTEEAYDVENTQGKHACIFANNMHHLIWCMHAHRHTTRVCM